MTVETKTVDFYCHKQLGGCGNIFWSQLPTETVTNDGLGNRVMVTDPLTCPHCKRAVVVQVIRGILHHHIVEYRRPAQK